MRGRQRRPGVVARPPRGPIEDRVAHGDPAGRRLDPPQAGPEAFPQGSVAPEARAASDPRHGRGECDEHSLPGQFLD